MTFQRTPFHRAAEKKFNPMSDHLVTITSYDTGKAVLTGINQEGKTVSYKISHEAIIRGKKSEGYVGAKYFGHLIDDRMAKHLPVGTRVVLERARFDDRSQMFVSTRVINSGAQEESKLYCGLFSANAKDGRVFSVQSWSKQAFAVTDKEKFREFQAKLIDNCAKEASGVYVPYLGFQIRTMKKNPDGEGWLCFDSTQPYDHTPGEKDEAGNVTKKIGHMTKEKFFEICKEYASYIKETYPTFKEDGCVMDIMTCVSYKASTMSKYMQIGHEYSPLNKLTNKFSKVAADDVSGYNGKNMGVMGIIELTNDEIDRTTKTFKARNMVQKLHANNVIQDVRLMALAHDGAKVVLAEGLAPAEEVREEVKATAQAEASVVKASAALKSDADLFQGSVLEGVLTKFDKADWAAEEKEAQEQDPFGDE